MELGILFLLACLPVIVICRFIYCQDRNKEPIKLLLKFFLLGIASCFLVLFISEFAPLLIPSLNKDITDMNFLEVVLKAFIGVALIEEFCKWIFVYKVGYSHQEFDEVYDIIVYAVFVSLGFAFFENVVYVLGNGSIAVGISRGLLAVPGHACDAVFMGYYLCLAKLYAKQNKKDLEKKNILKSIFVPTLLHGIYDFCLFITYPIFMLVFFVFIVILYHFSLQKVKEVSEATNKIVYKNRFCPRCGNRVNSPFCSVCGERQE